MVKWDNPGINEDDLQFLDVILSGVYVSGNSDKGFVEINKFDASAVLELGIRATKAKRYMLAEHLLNLAEKKTKGVIDLHFCYNAWIDYLYKRRDDVEHTNSNGLACSNYEYIDRCVFYCMKDIEMLPKLFKAWEVKYGSPMYPVSIPAVTRLAIINEKRGNIDEAIKMCELAIPYGLWDSAKSGFEGRLEKLKAKLAKANK